MVYRAKDEVIKRLENSWGMMSNRIDHPHEEFLKNAKDGDLANKHFICLEEAFVPFQVGRFFILKKTMVGTNSIFECILHLRTLMSIRSLIMVI